MKVKEISQTDRVLKGGRKDSEEEGKEDGEQKRNGKKDEER